MFYNFALGFTNFLTLNTVDPPYHVVCELSEKNSPTTLRRINILAVLRGFQQEETSRRLGADYSKQADNY